MERTIVRIGVDSLEWKAVMRRPLLALIVVALALAVYLITRAPNAPIDRLEARDGANVPAADGARLADAGTADESTRTALAAAARATTVDPPFTASSVLLRVRVVDASSRASIAGVQVYASPRELDVHGHRIAASTGARGGLRQFTTTDADGRVEIDATPDVELRINANGSDAGYGAAWEDVAPRRAGETVELVLELKKRDDLAFWCRLVDEATRAPIANATVTRTGKNEALAKSDAGGLFSVRVTSWAPSTYQVTAPGHGFAYVASEVGHDSADRALEIALPESATLRVRVIDAPSSNATPAVVTLSAKPWLLAKPDGANAQLLTMLNDPTWKENTWDGGRGVLTELPPRVALRAEVRMGRVEWNSPEPLVLEPGETRDVEWRIGYGCIVSGRCVDQHGKPVAAHSMRMEHAWRNVPSYFQSAYVEGVAKRVRTDEDGRFKFVDIQAGTWWIGPEPRANTFEPPAPDDVAPFARVVDIAAGEERREIDLQVDRGLTIRGSVLDSSGKPVHAFVNALIDSAAPTPGTQTSKDGAFVLGPLAAGRYEIRAMASPLSKGGDSSSERVVANAGDENVVLRLRPGVVLAGRVIDERGDPARAAIAIAQPGSTTFGIHTLETKPDGTFRLANLDPGTFSIGASTADGRVGLIEKLALAGGEEATDLEVKLVPGGRIRVRYDGADPWGTIRILRGDTIVGMESLQKGASHEFSAPLGAVTVALRCYRLPRSEERAVTVQAGAVAEVAFGSD
jgi:hypothetical protein